MSRTAVSLDAALVAASPAPCAGCVRWQVGAGERRALGVEEAGARRVAWAREVTAEGRTCGVAVLVDGLEVGHLVAGWPGDFPGAQGQPAGAPSPDAALLAAGWVAPAWRSAGVGRLLVQRLAADLVRAGDVRAVEAYAAWRHGRSCLLPVGFLRSVGFHVERPHVLTPRLRMDLRGTRSWLDEVETALERVVASVRPPATTPGVAVRDHHPRDVAAGWDWTHGPARG